MLKKMSAALFAVSILAAPAFAANAAPTNPDQVSTGIAKSSKSAAAKPQLRKMSRHHRIKHRHFARYHKKVSRMHAAVKPHGVAKTRLGLAKIGHVKKASHKVSFSTMKKTGPKLSFKRVRPTTRRG